MQLTIEGLRPHFVVASVQNIGDKSASREQRADDVEPHCLLLSVDMLLNLLNLPCGVVNDEAKQRKSEKLCGYSTIYSLMANCEPPLDKMISQAKLNSY